MRVRVLLVNFPHKHHGQALAFFLVLEQRLHAPEIRGQALAEPLCPQTSTVRFGVVEEGRLELVAVEGDVGGGRGIQSMRRVVVVVQELDERQLALVGDVLSLQHVILIDHALDAFVAVGPAVQTHDAENFFAGLNQFHGMLAHVLVLSVLANQCQHTLYQRGAWGELTSEYVRPC